jgi:hypothetical protein
MKHKKIENILHKKIKPVLQDRLFSLEQLPKELNKHIGKYDIKFLYKYKKLNFIVVCGTTDIDEKRDIEIILRGKNEYQLTSEKLELFIFQVYQAILHELIHRQYLVDDGTYEKIVTEGDYLSHPEELRSHSHDIAMELTYNNTWDILDDLSKITVKDSITLYKYLKYFSRDHRVIKKLLKLINKWKVLEDKDENISTVYNRT